MAAHGSMPTVANRKRPRQHEGKMTTREAVAEVARYLIAYRGLQNKEVWGATNMLGQTVFYAIMRGDVVSDVKLSVLAGILSAPPATDPIPINTFRLMVDGDMKGIERLEMAAHIKQYILDVLSNSELPLKRRVNDH